MTWPNWNWELIEGLGIVIGGLVLFLSVNRWSRKRGKGGSHGYPMPNAWRSPDDASLSRIEYRGTADTNPTTGLPLMGGMDTAGNPVGSNSFDKY